METGFIVLSLIAGSVLAVQAGANAQLSKAIGSPFAATALQLSIGTVLLALIALATGTFGAVSKLPGVTWWHAVGGVASAFYVVSTILMFPRLGAVASVGLFIAGQILASVMLDTYGVLGVRAVDLGVGHLAGTVTVLAGTVLIVLGQKDGLAQFSLSKLGWVVLGLIAGAILPVQGAVNALLRQDFGGAPFAVGTISFFVATLAMTAVLVIAIASGLAQAPKLASLPSVPWWGWLGGFAGAMYVTTVFTAIPAIGAAVAVGLTVVGQQIASIFVDTYGWFRLPKRPVSAIRLIGVALLLIGVAAIKLI